MIILGKQLLFGTTASALKHRQACGKGGRENTILLWICQGRPCVSVSSRPRHDAAVPLAPTALPEAIPAPYPPLSFLLEVWSVFPLHNCAEGTLTGVSCVSTRGGCQYSYTRKLWGFGELHCLMLPDRRGWLSSGMSGASLEAELLQDPAVGPSSAASTGAGWATSTGFLQNGVGSARALCACLQKFGQPRGCCWALGEMDRHQWAWSFSFALGDELGAPLECPRSLVEGGDSSMLPSCGPNPFGSLV